MSSNDLRMIAHRALALEASPLMRHQRNARHALLEGIAFNSWGFPGPEFNKAAVLGAAGRASPNGRLSTSAAPTLHVVRELAERFFGTNTGGFGVMVEADAGHPVERELREAGWTVREDEPAMVLATLPQTFDVPSGLTIRVVRDAECRREFVAAMASGFASPTADVEPVSIESVDGMAPSLECALDPDVAILVGSTGDDPVATALMFRVGEIAGVTGVATAPAWRRRGFGTALTWAAIREGAARDCTCASLNALGASYEMYLTMGFAHVCNHRTYVPPA